MVCHRLELTVLRNEEGDRWTITGDPAFALRGYGGQAESGSRVVSSLNPPAAL